MYTTILSVLSLAIIFWGWASLASRQETKRLRSRGLLPEPGQTPTLEHVKRLVTAGEKIQAIKMYREIHRVGLKEAKDVVERMNLR